MTLRHCAGRASATAAVGIPPRVQASARRSISSQPAGLGSNGPSVVSPFTSHCTTPGARIFPAGNVVPRITRGTCRAIASSFPTPFCTDATAPSANACAVAAIARLGVHRLRRDDPEVAWRELGGVRRRAQPPDDLARARQPQPVRVDRVDVRAVEVVRPDLDVLELREVAPRRATPRRRSRRRRPSRRRLLRRRSRRPRRELAAARQPARTQDEDERHQRAHDDDPRPCGHLDRAAEELDAVLRVREDGVERADRERADDRAPEARRARRSRASRA